jgi:hypothetical protein
MNPQTMEEFFRQQSIQLFDSSSFYDEFISTGKSERLNKLNRFFNQSIKDDIETNRLGQVIE